MTMAIHRAHRLTGLQHSVLLNSSHRLMGLQVSAFVHRSSTRTDIPVQSSILTSLKPTPEIQFEKCSIVNITLCSAEWFLVLKTGATRSCDFIINWVWSLFLEVPVVTESKS